MIYYENVMDIILLFQICQAMTLNNVISSYFNRVTRSAIIFQAVTIMSYHLTSIVTPSNVISSYFNQVTRSAIICQAVTIMSYHFTSTG